MLESLLQFTDDEAAENAEWVENLWELHQDPLNLNRTSATDLMQIPFLPADVARSIIQYRNEQGRYNALEDLQHLKEMTPELFQALQPFVTIGSPPAPQKVVYRVKTSSRWPRSTGFEEDVYHNPYYLQHRLLYQRGDAWKGGIIWEKDAGESNFFDYGSFYIQYSRPNGRWSGVAGDYYLRLASGLVLWSPYRMPASAAAPVRLPVSFNRLSGNRSSDENSFLRGGAAILNIQKDIRLGAFYSRRKPDATLNEPDGSIRSYFATGLHRTATELGKRQVIEEQLFGLFLSRETAEFYFQVYAAQLTLDRSFRDFGTIHRYSGASFFRKEGEILPAAEVALYQQKFPALQGYLTMHQPDADFMLTAFYYHPQYLALHGRAYRGLADIPNNESGTAFLMQFRPVKWWRIGAYWLAFRPVKNAEENPQLKQDYALNFLFFFPGQNYRLQIKEKYRPLGLADPDSPEKQYSELRLDGSWEVNKAISLQNRLDLRWANHQENSRRYYGFALSHQLQWQLFPQWEFTARWSSFDVADYDLRIYEFEPDLPGSLRLVLLNDRGSKYFILLKWRPQKNYQIYLKYQRRFYPESQFIGSGLDAVEANYIQEIRAALVLQL
ncbi:MAG: helix-hairpin-helix domain-containing protein [Calditrichia bacterium]